VEHTSSQNLSELVRQLPVLFGRWYSSVTLNEICEGDDAMSLKVSDRKLLCHVMYN
jgi:hypothetical protein